MTLVLACCVGLVIVGIFGVINMSKMSKDEAELRDGMHHIALMQDVKNQFITMRLDLVYMLVLKESSKIVEKEKDFASQIESIRTKLAEIEKIGLEAKELEQLNVFRKGFEAYIIEGTKLAGMAKAAQAAGNTSTIDEATKFATGTVGPLYSKPAEIIAGLVTENVKDGDDMYLHGLKSFKQSRFLLLAAIIIVAVVSLFFGNIIANSVSRPLQSVLATLNKVSQGDLTAHSSITSKDEMGMLASEVNETAKKLNHIILMVAQNSEHVASAAAELHATAAEMATGSEQMAAQAGTVATASEEMSATSGDIAQNCHNAASGALEASHTAQTGAIVVENTVQVMSRIANRVMNTAKTVENLGARSDQIGEIVGTIEDIADQTNLLALNAAIEAARAGEQGRGFAVVADEVRALAERTTKATKEISDMIKAIQSETKGAVIAMEEGVREVENGTSEAAKSGTALKAILEQINSVNMQVSQIATAAEEQTATTSEISTNIQQINDVVRHTANGAHESVAAANQLSKLSEELQLLLRQFKL